MTRTEQPPSKTATVSAITVVEPWIQLPIVPGRPGAAYFTLRVGGSPDALVGVSTPVARTMLHETRSEAGVARMRPVKNQELPPGQTVGFSPGVKHAMLFDMDPSVKPGDRVPLTFTFRAAAPITVEAEVRPGGSHAGR